MGYVIKNGMTKTIVRVSKKINRGEEGGKEEARGKQNLGCGGNKAMMRERIEESRYRHEVRVEGRG